MSMLFVSVCVLHYSIQFQHEYEHELSINIYVVHEYENEHVQVYDHVQET